MSKRKRNIATDEMKKIELNILDCFSDYCRENGLDYSLCGGTLLGAIRHKGFIPWDDDIDVFVTRNSYRYLCKNFNRWGKKRHLRLINYFNAGYYSTFAKIIDTRTVAIEEKRNEKIGVWIDLFIVDYTKNNSKSFFSPIKKQLKEIRYYGSEDYFQKNNSIKDLFVNFKKWVIRTIKKPFYRAKIEKFINGNGGNNVISFSFADQIGWWEDIKELDFKNCKEIVFENKAYKAIGNWEEYLIHRYGENYLTPPPVKNREVHPLKKCNWK